MLKFLALLLSINIYSDGSVFHEIKYKTSFNNCPITSTGELTLNLLSKFRDNKSLFDLKKYIKNEKLEEKYFLKSFDISFNPINDEISFKYHCPNAIAKLQVYKEDGTQSYFAVLSDEGKRVDPNYENVLRSEKILKQALPLVSINHNQITDRKLKDFAKYLNSINSTLYRRISDLIIDEDEKLIVILKNPNHAVTAFLGKDDWQRKSKRLLKSVEYFDEKKKYPRLLKFVNSKKIVVKFSHRL